MPISLSVCAVGRSRQGLLPARNVWYDILSSTDSNIYADILKAKLNQILRIEEELGDKAIFVGNNFRKAVDL